MSDGYDKASEQTSEKYPDRAFEVFLRGHNGAFGQVAWADPETGLSFAYVTDGLDEHVIRQGKRGVALSSLANACVQ